MPAPLIEIHDVFKSYQSLRPLRIKDLRIAAGDRLALRGFDAGAAEMFIHLVTGAALPDEGAVRVAGRDTREIATDTEWLSSLDRFGIVTHRAVLLEPLSLAENLALPMTISIDPMPDDVRQRVQDLAVAAGFGLDALPRKVASLGEEEKLWLHLARAVANGPELLLLEHPTHRLNDAEASRRLGRSLRNLSEARRFGWVALTEDERFAEAAGGTALELDAATGHVAPPKRGWRRWL